MTGSGETFFGLTSGRLPAGEAERRDRIARSHGARFVYALIPGDGWRGWYAAPSRGAPFDEALAERVLAAVEGSSRAMDVARLRR